MRNIKILIFLIGIGISLNLFTQANAQTDTPDEPAQTTDGPEGSEISPSNTFSDEKKFGLGITFGQTLLTGDDSGGEKGFNDTLGFGLSASYRLRDRLNMALKYWTSSHDGVEKTSGDLRRSHVTGEVSYYFARGTFSPYGVAGAGVYSSEFRPSSQQKLANIDSSSIQTFGLLVGAGIDFEIAKRFIVGVGVTRHHSFKRKNEEREVNEAVPFHTVALTGTIYF